ncbi:MAG: hypothetical protein HZB13_11070 [Acidobacteria bacterium]|nr:hypothetical protein [Acidobacteriota bacterium]
MRTCKHIGRLCAFAFAGLAIVWACAFDTTLREYLDARFWLPFSKQAAHFERPDIQRASEPFAGMAEGGGKSPLAALRAAYREISVPVASGFDLASKRRVLAAARADQSLTLKEREEVDLIDAKIDMRVGQPDEPQLLLSAKEKLNRFLSTAQTPEFLSEARGWLARIHFLLGEQTAAGKIYLDELNRNGSNLSRETILTSLQMTYRYDGGADLLAHLEEYFDTPEHAAFAIQLVTNPRWDRMGWSSDGKDEQVHGARQTFARVAALLEKHAELLRSEKGANALALLAMRVALRMGDPPAALKIASRVSSRDPVRAEPDFLWMLAASRFLSRQYAATEAPLLKLFRSSGSSDSQKAAAAYALCGVYQKTGNVVEQIRFALWLRAAARRERLSRSTPSAIEDQTIYWAASGWDLSLLLDAEASPAQLAAFLERYPNVPEVRLVRYSLAVRLSREHRYEEAATIFESIHALRRSPRMRQMAALHAQANRTDLSAQAALEARYRLAEFISANPDRIYFNDALWMRLQRYALDAAQDGRLSRPEREAQIARERKLKDEQEELWRAYLILREVVRDAGNTAIGRDAARLALTCLRRISDRFGRQSEIRHADLELSAWLRR